MPYIPHTPESLIPRSDSKNPATTCKGVTSSGRPCRRSLAASGQNSPSPSPHAKQGVLAVLPDVDDEHDAAAAFFCWQHKYQARNLAGGGSDSSQNPTRIIRLKQRSSVDTLMDRLGVLEVQDSQDAPAVTSKKPQRGPRPVRREALPQKWQQVPGPLLVVSEDRVTDDILPRPKPQRRRRPAGETNLIFSFFCCSSESADLEYVQAPRVRYKYASSPLPTIVEGDRISERNRPIAKVPAATTVPHPARPTSQQQQRRTTSNYDDEHIRPLLNHQTPLMTPTRPPLPRNPASSQTQNLLSLIPQTLSPQTTSHLLTELAKPISASDQDGGWIYIFWLTPNTSAALDASLASSLLAPPLARPNTHTRRTSDVVRDYSSTATGNNGNSAGKKTILLKIGRASNVQRRLNEWSRQCNHNLSLIRYYPYHPSAPSTPASVTTDPFIPSPHKVPHAHRVERLIHIELAEKRVKRVCDGCGKEHREWFEVEGTREGIRGVDAVVRRWVEWAVGLGL